MKSTIAASLFALSMLVLGGCSTMHDKSSMAQSSVSVDDQVYVARVEQAARDRGVQVRWINPPQKRVANQL
jgi:hypothetical protein